MSDEQTAQDLAEVLMRKALSGGPLSRIAELNRVLRILRLVVRIITARRDREAYALGAVWPQRPLAKLAGVTPSTMQRWSEAGAKAVEAQNVSRETAPEDIWLLDTLPR